MMFYRVFRFGVVVVCVGVLAGWGCSRRPGRVHAPGIDASAAGQRALEQYDTDGDGLIGDAELDKTPALKASIKNLDTNGDQKVSAEEITARIEKWQKDRVGKMSLVVKVTRAGRPLAGASVKFVPEKFLGDEIQAAEGGTESNGLAYLSVPLDPDNPGDVPGVHCGLYRVEISKIVNGKEMIPAKYNTETTLGQEISLEAENIQEGIQFDLK